MQQAWVEFNVRNPSQARVHEPDVWLGYVTQGASLPSESMLAVWEAGEQRMRISQGSKTLMGDDGEEAD